jgi:hypothetical protein
MQEYLKLLKLLDNLKLIVRMHGVYILTAKQSVISSTTHVGYCALCVPSATNPFPFSTACSI